MNQELLKLYNMTETELTQAVEHYKATGQVLNRLVAVEIGLVEEY